MLLWQLTLPTALGLTVSKKTPTKILMLEKLERKKNGQ